MKFWQYKNEELLLNRTVIIGGAESQYSYRLTEENARHVALQIANNNLLSFSETLEALLFIKDEFLGG